MFHLFFGAKERFQIPAGSAGVARDCGKSIPNTSAEYQWTSTIAAAAGSALNFAVPTGGEITVRGMAAVRNILCFVFEAEVQQTGSPTTGWHMHDPCDDVLLHSDDREVGQPGQVLPSDQWLQPNYRRWSDCGVLD